MIVILTKKRKITFRLSDQIAALNSKLRILGEQRLTAQMNNDKFDAIYARIQMTELENERDELIEILKKL